MQTQWKLLSGARNLRASPSWNETPRPRWLGALARQPHQVARAVDAGDVLEAAPRQLQHVAPLAAAQIEDPVVGLQPGAAHQQVDLLLGVAVVLDDVAVGFEIERVEERAPPFGRQVALEVGDRAQRARRAALGGLAGEGRLEHCAGGRAVRLTVPFHHRDNLQITGLGNTLGRSAIAPRAAPEPIPICLCHLCPTLSLACPGTAGLAGLFPWAETLRRASTVVKKSCAPLRNDSAAEIAALRGRYARFG